MIGSFGILARVNVINCVMLTNPSACECDKFCDVDEYLDYVNCKYRKKLTDQLVEECSADIDGNKMTCNTNYGFGLNEKACKTYMLYVIL